MAAKLYTPHEVARHNTEESLWMIIHGKVYDVTTYIDEVSQEKLTRLFQDFLPIHPSHSSHKLKIDTFTTKSSGYLLKRLCNVQLNFISKHGEASPGMTLKKWTLLSGI